MCVYSVEVFSLHVRGKPHTPSGSVLSHALHVGEGGREREGGGREREGRGRERGNEGGRGE